MTEKKKEENIPRAPERKVKWVGVEHFERSSREVEDEISSSEVHKTEGESPKTKEPIEARVETRKVEHPIEHPKVTWGCRVPIELYEFIQEHDAFRYALHDNRPFRKKFLEWAEEQQRINSIPILEAKKALQTIAGEEDKKKKKIETS